MTEIHTPTIADLSDRAMFRLSGPDAERYLNGQITQDVRLATEENAVYSVVTNFKGKLLGDCYIRRYEGDILIDTSAEQRDSLFARLDQYLIADDAELIDVTGSLSLFFSTLADAVGWDICRYGVDGKDVIGTPENVDSALSWDAVRIMNAIPAWNSELDDSILPADASLEQRAISYTKGCYTGQEVISRMKSAAKTNQHLVKICVDKNMTTPKSFFRTLEDKKPAGKITSLTQVDNKWIGLGYRTRKAKLENKFMTEEGHLVSIL